MSKHTPGPWRAAAQRNNTLIVSPSENRAVAECFGVVGEEPSANAALIAAAPDLLEAALLTEEGARHSVECPACDASYEAGIPEACPEGLALIKRGIDVRLAAIAKAEGR